MTNEKKKELFPYFAWVYSKEINPSKYGSLEPNKYFWNLIK